MPYDPQLDRIIGFFEPTVLAQYRSQPDKYDVTSDNFDGKVSIAEDYYRSLSEEEQDSRYISVRFGYRTLKNGELRVAAFLPDLVQKSKGHIGYWRGYLIDAADWEDFERDDRFSLWVRRYMEGSWEVDNGPVFYLREELTLINGLSLEAFGARLYDVENPPISFPAADNTWSYEDAHLDLYRVLFDGFDKGGLAALGAHVGRSVNVGDKNTFDALNRLLPQLRDNSTFVEAFESVAKHRRAAGHKVRPPARSMRAFATFDSDLSACLSALKVLRMTLEKELKLDAKKSRRRQEALKWLPKIVRGSEGDYSINVARLMRGKTVQEVEVGLREHVKGAHHSECIIISFTDGSIMSIDTGCGIPTSTEADHLHVDFRIHWVPAPGP